MPNLLVAPISPTNQSKRDGLYDDYPQGYYADGAYTAAPFPGPSAAGRKAGGSDDEDLDPQEAYYTALGARFAELSSFLQAPPQLPDGAPVPPSTYKSRQWRHKILKSTPKMISLAQIPQDSTVLGIEVLEDILTAGNLRSVNGRNVGAWAWGLLARCRDVGMMGSEEVGVLRKLGKKAVWLLRRIAAGEVVEDDVEDEVAMGDDDINGEDAEEENEVDMRNADAEEDGDEGDARNMDIGEGEEEMDESLQIGIGPVDGHVSHPPPSSNEDATEAALAEARLRVLASLNSTAETPPANGDVGTQHENPSGPLGIPRLEENKNGTDQSPNVRSVPDREAIHATLDMIVTVVGDFYGQRDLLDGRLLWDEIA